MVVGSTNSLGKCHDLFYERVQFVLRKSLGDTVTDFKNSMEISGFIPTEIETK